MRGFLRKDLHLKLFALVCAVILALGQRSGCFMS